MQTSVSFGRKTSSFLSTQISPRSSLQQCQRASVMVKVSRRRVVSDLTAAGMAVGGIVAMAGAAYASGTNPFKNPRVLTSDGMQKFIINDIEGSIKDFDEVIRLDSARRPYMWQRGLSLYYVGRYKEAAEQFRIDVAVNPNDTEEAVWAFLSEAREPSIGKDKARKNFLETGRDSRPVMRTVLEVFKNGTNPDAILAAAGKDDMEGHDRFYALLYHGLFHEAEGNEEEARKSITAACKTFYAKRSGDYMSALARVHAVRRGWKLDA